MEIILLEDVSNLGGIGELVSVKRGYARNYLIPRKLAILASGKNKARLEHEQRLAGFKLQKAKAESAELAKRLSGVAVTIARKVGEQEKMYGSVTSHDIAQALAEMKLPVERKHVQLQDPIKTLGDHSVVVRLRADVKVEIKVSVVAEQ